MSDFFSQSKIKKTRKPHLCRHCNTMIDIGSEALRIAGCWDGDFGTYYSHRDCMVAGDAYANATNCWGEEYVFLCDAESEGHWGASDRDWVRNSYPSVAARLSLPA